MAPPSLTACSTKWQTLSDPPMASRQFFSALWSKPRILCRRVGQGPISFAAKGTLTGMVACPPNGVDVFAKFNGNGAVYQDNVQSYSTVEPAIDLSASSFLAFAWRVAGVPSGTP